MKKMFFVCIAFMMMVIMGCENEPNRYNMSAPYEISHYVDTICGSLILTTVCNNPDNTCLSVSSLSLGKVDTTELIK
jgi:hypothetical protein